MKRLLNGLATAALIAAAGTTAFASSHREALAILNEPCADNTDTYAWVTNTTHDKLYLIMDFYPLHEPGQGNHGLRACNGYRYEFHIGMGAGLADRFVYRVEFKNSLKVSPPPTAKDAIGGGNELLWQLTGGTETMTVTRLKYTEKGQLDSADVIGRDLPVLPNNHGPQTDRLVYGLGTFKGYDSKDPSSREQGLYDQNFIDTYIQNLSNNGRVIAGQFDDPYQLDEKGIFDLVNLSTNDLGGIPGARRGPTKDVFTGFNIFSIAMEVPITELFPAGVPKNNPFGNGTDMLLRIWSRIMKQKTQTVDTTNIITGLKGSGEWVQVGRNALPLFDAGLVGAQSQTMYLHTSPMKDVTNFGAYILFPTLVRDAEALGIYKALNVPDSAVANLKGPRLDIINAINLGRSIPVADGYTGDVITLDPTFDSAFPNGRRLGGGPTPNSHQVNVNSVLISLIVAGDAKAGLAKGVEVNDKDFLPRFPFLAPANQGLLQGHGGTNTPTNPVIPIPGIQ